MRSSLSITPLLFAICLISVARSQCFTSSSGAICCPETFPCSSTRCIIDPGCDRGAETCTSNVCRRPGSTPPPAPVFAPAPAPAPVPVPASAPVPVPAPAPVPTPAPAPVQDAENQDSPASPEEPPVELVSEPDESPSDVPNGDRGEQTVYDDLLECSGNRVRKEIRDMSDEEWNDFVNAVNELRIRDSRFNPGVNQYEDLARIHREFVVEAHGGSFFLPWHRLFVLLFENLLREINPSVAIPYWNWAVDGEDAAMSGIWARVGGSARTFENTPGCIPDGPFQNINTNNPDFHCVRRSFNTYQSGSMIPFDNWFTIQALMNSDASFPQFAAALESTHGSPHVGVGGDMAVLGTAPNDPIFFMHHAFVDLIYVRWQHNGNGFPGRFGGTNPGVIGNVRRDSYMRAFERTVRYAQKLDCIEYEDFSGSFVLNSGGGPIDFTVKKLPQDFMETNHINQTRVSIGEAVLQDAVDKALSGE